MKADARYYAAGGNRHPSAADWDTKTGLLAYGAGRNLAIWEPQVGGKCLLPYFPCNLFDRRMVATGSRLSFQDIQATLMPSSSSRHVDSSLPCCLLAL